MRRIVPCTEEDSNIPELWEEETIDFTLENVELNFRSDAPPIGSGKLFVTSKRVIWLGQDEKAFDFDVKYITLHAITRDTDSYPKPCIYCQLDAFNSEDGGDADGDEDAEEEEEILDEMYIVPSSEDQLQSVFDALSTAAMKNPDDPEEWEQDGDDELIYNTDEVELGAEQARTLAHLESVFNVPAGYGEFEEGEGEEEEEGAEDADDGVEGQFDDNI